MNVLRRQPIWVKLGLTIVLGPGFIPIWFFFGRAPKNARSTPKAGAQKAPVNTEPAAETAESAP